MPDQNTEVPHASLLALLAKAAVILAVPLTTVFTSTRRGWLTSTADTDSWHELALDNKIGNNN